MSSTDENSRDLAKFTFYGRIHPERSNAMVSSVPFQISRDSFQADLQIDIGASQLSVLVSTDEDIPNIHTLKNLVKAAVHTVVDTFSYTRGYYYDVEITSVITPTNEHIVFGVDIPIIGEKFDEEEFVDRFNEILSVYTTESGDFLRRCLSDFRSSMERAEDTGFFCYRTIESIRQYFHTSGMRDRDSWRELRENLGVERDDIDSIKAYADPRRHGDRAPLISDSDRAEIFDTTWEIIDSFIDYLLENEVNNS